MRVLIVEDEVKIAKSIKKGFELMTWVVDVAYDGVSGYDMASSEEYDAIILDLMLPKLSGIEISKKLRLEKNQTPILMLTAKGEITDKVKGFEVGADDYLVKPFAFAELVARVKALARRPAAIKNSKLVIGNLKLDTNSMEVTNYGKKVEFSRKEYSLLEYLMKNAGKVMSKEKIISNVWDYEADILPNTVEVFIGYLRAKIGKDVIKTVRGFGYKIEK